MKINVSHHVFASVKGYRTQFRSSDVADDESVELESYSFGQTNDSRYIKSLSWHPAYTIRKLRSNRWAITRVFEGPNDEYNRTTLLFHTILIDRTDWIDRLGCDILPILDHPSLWKDKTLSHISVMQDNALLPQEIKDEVESLSAKLATATRTVIIYEAVCPLEVIRWVNRLLAVDKKEIFTYGYRVLSDSMEASLLCLSEVAICVSSRNIGQYANAVSGKMPALVQRREERFESNDYHIDKGSGVINKTAILIISVISIVGVIGILLSLLMLLNYKKHVRIEIVMNKAKTFISAPDDPHTRRQIVDDGKKISDQLNIIISKSPSVELEKLHKDVNNRIEDTEKKDRIEAAIRIKIDDLKGILSGKMDVYPDSSKMQKVLSICIELVKDRAESNLWDDIEIQVDNACKDSDRWIRNAGELLIVTEKKIGDISQSIRKNNPDLYAISEPNQIGLTKPILNTAIDPNLRDNTDPNRFLTMRIADKHIHNLELLRPKISEMQRDRSLGNATGSPKSDHKKWANKLLSDLNDQQKVANDYGVEWKYLITSANTFKNIEINIQKASKNIPFNNAVLAFNNALDQYKSVLTNIESKKYRSDIEMIWCRNCSKTILEYYKIHVHPTVLELCKTIATEPDKNILNNMLNKINQSPLFEESEFNLLRSCLTDKPVLGVSK